MTSRVVLITGASAGFGRACADHLAAAGHRVYGTSRRASFDAAGQATEGVVRIPMDVRDAASVRDAVAFVHEREGRLDVVVNNAGVGLAGSIEDTSPAEAREIFETNFFGAHRVCRAALPLLRAQGSGLVVNISSLGGRVTIPFQGFYSASKYALEAMSDALRMELAPFGVRVCVIEPGDFKTDFTASRTFAEAGQGDSAYAVRAASAVAVMEQDERGGAEPHELAVRLARLIDDPSPPPRIPVGRRLQRWGVAATRLLPARWVDRLLAALYKI